MLPDFGFRGRMYHSLSGRRVFRGEQVPQDGITRPFTGIIVRGNTARAAYVREKQMPVVETVVTCNTVSRGKMNGVAELV